MKSAPVQVWLPAISAVWLWLASGTPGRAETFTIATYNVENYLDTATATRPAKSDAARAQVRRGILALHPDILALQEIGAPSALRELQSALQTAGLPLPYAEHLTGFDTNIHVAVLSRFPSAARTPHTNDDFLLGGRRYHVSRGFAELEFQITPGFRLTLLVAHLKSRRAIPSADEGELRLAEARILRQIVDARLATNPAINLVVAGDLNDTPDSPSTLALMGKGRGRLVDTRPAEDPAAEGPPAGSDAGERRITWTHHFARDDTFSRIDYLLLSRGMADHWIAARSRVLRIDHWGVASDHRPVLATFDTEAR